MDIELRSIDELPPDPGEIIALAFGESFAPRTLAEIVRRHPGMVTLTVSVAAVGAVLPDALERVLWFSTLCAFLALLAPFGTRLRDHAWREPSRVLDLSPRADGDHVDRVDLACTGAALLLLVAPLALGFRAGIEWSFLLAIPSAAIGMLFLVTAPLHRAGSGFPFAVPPLARECGAFCFAGLVGAAGALGVAILVWIGSWAHLPALVLALATWTFFTRSSGLLARDVHDRVCPPVWVGSDDDLEDEPAWMTEAATPLAPTRLTHERTGHRVPEGVGVN